ncbi:MAG: mechanosensitive ion channel family protein [Bacteroidota bacterium]
MKFWNSLKTVSIGYYELFILYLPRIVLGTVVLIVIWTLAGRAKRALKKRLGKTMDDPLLVDFLSQILKVSLIVFGLLLFLGIVGLGKAASGLLAGAGVSAFIIGFAFKDIGENFLAGIIMAFDRPFRIGDVVEIAGKTGKIIGLTLRDTHVKTFDGKDVYIPNGMIVRNPIVNLTIDGFLRNDFTVRLTAGANVDEAITLVRRILGEVAGVLKEDRAPNIFIADYQPSGISLAIQYWFNTNDPNVSSLALKTEVIQKCLSALKKAGFHLPPDVREIHITGGQLSDAD